MKKIYISPSDQVNNYYAAGNTTEAEQCRKIATTLVDDLNRCGFSAKTNVTDSMYARVSEGNVWNCDLYVCIHTNAYNGEVSGTRIFSYDLKGNGYVAAKTIFKWLAPVTPGSSENIKAYPKLYEIRTSNAPCVYIEVDFHDVPSVAKWIVEHTKDIATAICKGICEYFKVSYVEDSEGDKDMAEYRYQTVSELPKWAVPGISELIEMGALTGTDKGLNLTEDMIRTMLVGLNASKKINGNS